MKHDSNPNLIAEAKRKSSLNLSKKLVNVEVSEEEQINQLW